MIKTVEIQNKINQVVRDFQHVLSEPLATVDINAPRALSQVSACAKLDVLYGLLSQQRPRFPCDSEYKINQ